MPDYEITAPDGQKFRVTAPEGATPVQVLEYARERFSSSVSAPAPPAGPERTAARGLGLGVRNVVQGVAALPGLAYDLAALPINAGVAGINALGGNLPYVNRAAENVSATATAAGLPQAHYPSERLLGGAIEGAASGLPTMGAGVIMQARGAAPMLANALGAGLWSQSVGGAAGGYASAEAAEQGAGPWGQLGAGLLGGLGGAAATQGVMAGGRTLNTLLEPLYEGGRQKIVGAAINRFASNPDALPGRLLSGAEERVPGSAPTSAEAALDPGLAGLERTVRNTPEGAPQFADRDAARDAARRAEMLALEPTTGGAPAVAVGVQNALAREEQRLQQVQTRAERRLGEREATLPPPVAPEQAGTVLRAGLDDAEAAGKQAVGRAYEAVDPDGTLQMPLQPIQAAAREAEARFFGEMGGEVPGALRSALDDIAGAGEGASWRALQNLRSRLGEIAGDRTQPRAAAAARAVRQSIDDAAENAAMPFERPSRPVTEADIAAGWADEGAAQNPDIAARLAMGRDDLAATGADGAPPPVGLSLVQFIRRLGGLQNQGGDLGAMMGGTGRTMPGLWNNSGLTLERAAEAAWEAGYIRGSRSGDAGPVGSTPRDLLDALEAELKGISKSYRGEDVRAQRGSGRAPNLADDLDQEVAARGGTYQPGDDAATLRSLRDRPEAPPGAGAEPPDRFSAVENPFTPEAAERWRTAGAMRRELGETFDRDTTGANAAGQILKRDTYGNPVMPDRRVADTALRSGDDLRQVLRSQAERPESMAALESHAATSLRDFARREDGTLDPARWRRWMADHRGALAELPELRARLASVGEAAATVERVAGLAKASRREIESGVARHFLGKDPADAVRGALGAGNASQQIGELRRLIGNDPAALAGLRRAYLDEWLRRATTTTENAAGDFKLSPAAAQRFFRDNDGAARQLFGTAEQARIEALAADFARGQYGQNAGRAVGSNTVQNLSTANLLAQVSNGVIDANNSLMHSTVGRLLGWAYKHPERLMREMLVEATLDPALMAALSAKASAGSLRRVQSRMQRTLGEWAADEIGPRAVEAGTRQGLRTAGDRAEDPDKTGGAGLSAPEPRRNSLMR